MPVSIPLPWQGCTRATEGDSEVRGTVLHGLIGGVAALILATTPLVAQAAPGAAGTSADALGAGASQSGALSPGVDEPVEATQSGGESADGGASVPSTDSMAPAHSAEAQSEAPSSSPKPPVLRRAPRSATALTPIPDIQTIGEGDDSALVGVEVITRGVVTASYPYGEDGLTSTLSGFVIQTPGTGGTWDPARTASDAIFAYVGTKAIDVPAIGSCVQVAGKVFEYPETGSKTPASTQSLTQISVSSVSAVEGCEPVAPTPLDTVPTGAQMEALESMLIAPQGTWTITDNYSAGQYGTLSLAPGTEPLRAATDVVAPGDQARAYEAENAARAIALDDGTNTNLGRAAATEVPYAYLANGAPARVGYTLAFDAPVILDSRHKAFVLQPTRMVAAHPDRSPVTISGERPTMPVVGGDIRVATFNVLNYFSDLGENEAGCSGYPDREGNFVTAKKCSVRGAYSSKAFAMQQSKIVAAITEINADVVALEEIENSAVVGASKDRDAALKNLVEALNAKAGAGTWAYVPSPTNVPANEDVIRVAFIYRPSTVEPVGESTILDDPAFTGLARQPLAQEFTPVVTETQVGRSVVVIANHFKSKGSVPKGMEESNTDSGDGQGNANAVRVAQAKALAAFAESFSGKPTLLVGDFNSYAKEDPLAVLEAAGWNRESGSAHPSYVYSGRSGSLDHVFSNAVAHPLVVGVASWAINAQESVAFEYSRSNANMFLATETTNPYRSSDHNPEIIGLDLVRDVEPSPNPQPQPQPQGTPGQTPPARTSPSASRGLARTGVNDGFALITVAGLVLGAVGVAGMAASRKRR